MSYRNLFLHLDIQLEDIQQETEAFERDYISHDIESIILELSELQGMEGQHFLEKTVDLINQLGDIPPSRKLDKKMVEHLLEEILSGKTSDPSEQYPSNQQGKDEQVDGKPIIDEDIKNKKKLEEWF